MILASTVVKFYFRYLTAEDVDKSLTSLAILHPEDRILTRSCNNYYNQHTGITFLSLSNPRFNPILKSFLQSLIRGNVQFIGRKLIWLKMKLDLEMTALSNPMRALVELRGHFRVMVRLTAHLIFISTGREIAFGDG